MGSEFTFHDYVDEAGVNTIHAWLQTIPPKVKVKLTNRLLHLEATRQGDWRRPAVDTLTDQCDGLFEIRARLSRRQYRLLGSHGPGRNTPTLLFGFIKSGARVAISDCNEAFVRRARVLADPQNRRVEHDYE